MPSVALQQHNLAVPDDSDRQARNLLAASKLMQELPELFEPGIERRGKQGIAQALQQEQQHNSESAQYCSPLPGVHRLLSLLQKIRAGREAANIKGSKHDMAQFRRAAGVFIFSEHVEPTRCIAQLIGPFVALLPAAGSARTVDTVKARPAKLAKRRRCSGAAAPCCRNSVRTISPGIHTISTSTTRGT